MVPRRRAPSKLEGLALLDRFTSHPRRWSGLEESEAQETSPLPEGRPPDPKRVDGVRAFLSKTQLSRIARLGARRDVVERSWGAIVTIDVSGFSALAERHAREGARGIEALSEIVHVFFGAITEEVLRGGGDVLYHAGDAVCALFAAPTEAERDQAVRRAVHAALGAHGRLEAAARAAGVGLRSAVACGETRTWEIGGLEGAWVLMVQGEAIDDNARVDQLAASGEVSVSEAVWQRLGTERRGHRAEGGVYRVASGAAPLSIAPIGSPPSASREAIIASLSPAVRSRFEAEDAPPAAEFRPVSTFFASLPDVDLSDAAVLPRLQQAVVSMQAECARLGLAQLEVLGDKGLGFVGVFGLPPQAHDDDAVRAIDAALAVHSAFAAHGMEAGIGVASGVVWAGPAGATGRHCYDVVGPTMILAARLMQVAQGRVLVCAQTRRLAARSVELVELAPIALKGFAVPHAAARVVGRRTHRVRSAPRLAGRDTELARVVARIDAVVEGRGGAALLEAEPGMGKSVLLQAARELASKRGVSCFGGGADSVELTTPYFAVRGAVLELLGVPAGASAASARELTLARVEADAPELAWLAPLLEAIVPFDLPDSAESAQIVGTTRAERLGDLLVALARAAAARGPVIWSIEDLHWADRASWSLCRRLVEEVSGLLLLGTSRPMASPPLERDALARGEAREVIVLDDLPAAPLGEIVAMRLGVSALPADVLAMLVARADGNPFFAEEIALAARDAGGLVVHEGQVHVARALDALDLPTSITGVITSRIDRLGVAERAALRCAAVLGPSFEIATLRSLLGSLLGEPAGELEATVQRLADATFLDPDPGTSADGWRFRHAFLHETAYALVTFAERRALHAAAAQAIESTPELEIASVTALLAHHWEIAEQSERAAHYHGQAGRQALEADANVECVEHLTKALRFDEAVRGPRSVDLVRARWARMLTEASYSLGRHADARRWGEQTLGWSGLRVPTHAGHVLSNLARHVVRRYVPAPQADAETRARYAEGLLAASTLQVVATWGGDRIGQLSFAVYADVVSRSCVPSAGRATAQSLMSFILVLAGLHEVGVRDAKDAVDMADTLGDATARMSTKVILGLSLSGLGRNREALAPLAEATRLAERVGSGLWRHRALFQSGEPHYQLGELEVADELFDRCVEVARKVEPPVAGFCRAMQAACRLRAGKSPAEALALLEGPDGVVVAEPGPTLMALVALGVHAWALLLTHRYADALTSARKCNALVTKQSDDAIAFARAVDGHAHAALTLTRLYELVRLGAAGTEGLPPREVLLREATQALENLKRLAARWPAARPLAALVEAYQLRLAQKPRHARRALERAAQTARTMAQPWELALALRTLGRHHGQPADAELSELLAAHGLGGVALDHFPL